MARVLIVEDNPANMTLAVFLLQSVGHTVIRATDAAVRLKLRFYAEVGRAPGGALHEVTEERLVIAVQ